MLFVARHPAEAEVVMGVHSPVAVEKQVLPPDLLILDEACAAWNLNMVDRELLQNAVLHKPAEQELAMTGRDPALWMLDAADYITEMCCRRHPYEKGIPARKGVEF